jgi:hypothetical protein
MVDEALSKVAGMPTEIAALYSVPSMITAPA